MSYGGRVVGKVRRMVWELYPHVCYHCGRPVEFATFTVEHLLPRSKGGSNHPANLRPACGSRATGGCGTNYARGNKPIGASAENQLAFFE